MSIEISVSVVTRRSRVERWMDAEHMARTQRTVQQLVDDIERAETALRVRLNELLDYGYSYETLSVWLGVSRKTFYRRYVEVQKSLF